MATGICADYAQIPKNFKHKCIMFVSLCIGEEEHIKVLNDFDFSLGNVGLMMQVDSLQNGYWTEKLLQMR